jgi:histone H3/H4
MSAKAHQRKKTTTTTTKKSSKEEEEEEEKTKQHKKKLALPKIAKKKQVATARAFARPPPAPPVPAARVDPYRLGESVVRKFMLRSKSNQISTSVHDPMNAAMRSFVQDIIKHAISFAVMGNRTTLKPRDVQRSFEIIGVEIY